MFSIINIHVDTTKAQKLLGYEPTYTIREGVEEFVEWHRATGRGTSRWFESRKRWLAFLVQPHAFGVGSNPNDYNDGTRTNN